MKNFPTNIPITAKRGRYSIANIPNTDLIKLKKMWIEYCQLKRDKSFEQLVRYIVNNQNVPIKILKLIKT